ncbi:MAG: OmpA family protein, partial [Phycisphaerae bacterium]
MSRWSLLGLMGLSMLAGAGCAKQPIETGPSQVDLLNQQIRDLERRLAEAQAARDADEARIRQLQDELARLRQQLATKPEPTPPPDWKSVPGGAMTSIEGTVLFDSGKAVLKPGARQTLDAIARTIRENFMDHDIYVFGHTDNEPIRVSGWKDNYELSAQRALTVVRYLRGALGAGAEVAAAGWGETRPIAPNTTAEQRQRNRRVEIFAMRPEAAVPGGRSASRR